ncbi:universal stress protein [Carboxydothermus pertinax]|uniref:UspA domain-containing protein n=1 Tax=Carboxydothermus pertinax TaxID=870242 RepID=A0A1L8CVH6_9THEO|nr:universal stress protein [Carboxydothermus pertinax]GAV22897.1 hypothetical protein cpu_14070 [Carboxydothermus pertinax]
MFKKILVGIDGSAMGDKAFNTALTLAKGWGAELFLVHVMPMPTLPNVFPPGAIAYVPESVLQDLTREIKEKAEKTLEERLNQVKEKGVTGQIKVLKGEPASAIASFAQEEGIDLIVVGSRGISGVKELMLGSVSHKISQLARCPILIVK